MIALVLILAQPLLVAGQELPCVMCQERGGGVRVHVVDSGGKPQKEETLIYENSYALLIGNSLYKDPAWKDLPDVDDDIQAVKEILEKEHGFKVEVALNQNRDSLLRVIDKFISRHGQRYDNRLLIYYSGHGYTALLPDERRMGYLVMPDAPPMPTEEKALMAPPTDEEFGQFLPSAITTDEVETFARRILAKHVLFVFDSCFSGTVLYKDLGTGTPHAVTTEELKPVRAFLTAGNERQRVPAFSKFRRKFVAALSGDADTNGDGLIFSSELGRWVQLEVEKDTSRQQTPVFGKLLFSRGDLVFVSPKLRSTPASSVVPPKTPTEPDFGASVSAADNERAAFLAVQKSVDTNEIRAVLEEYKTSRYAPDLRKRLDRLVWESVKNSHDRAKIQAYLDEFGDVGQFASLARIEMRKLTAAVAPKPSPFPAGGSAPPSTTPSSTAAERPASPSIITPPVADRVNTLAQNALSQVLVGNDAEAKKLADEALRLDNNSPLALAVLGWSTVELDDGGRNGHAGNEAARLDLERAVKLEPKNALFRARLISIYDNLGKPEEAWKAAKKVLSLLRTPVTAPDYYAWGLAHYRMGENAAAVADFTKAIVLEPKFALAYFARGRASQFGDKAAARADFIKVLEINPHFLESKWSGSMDSRVYTYSSFTESYYKRGLEHYEAGRYDEAIAELNKAIEVYPGLYYYQFRGLAYHQKKQYDEAIRDLSVVISSDPKWPGLDVYFYRALSYSEKGNFDEALADYAKSFELKPSAAALNNRAVIFYNRREYETAIREYTKAIAFDPNYGTAYRNRADAYDVLRRGELAAADRREAVAADQRKAAEKKTTTTEGCTCDNIPMTVIPVPPR